MASGKAALAPGGGGLPDPVARRRRAGTGTDFAAFAFCFLLAMPPLLFCPVPIDDGEIQNKARPLSHLALRSHAARSAAEPLPPDLVGTKLSKGSKRVRARADAQAEHEPSQGAGYLTVNPLFAGGAGSTPVAVSTSSGDQGGTSSGHRPRLEGPRKGSRTLCGFDADETTMDMRTAHMRRGSFFIPSLSRPRSPFSLPPRC